MADLCTLNQVCFELGLDPGSIDAGSTARLQNLIKIISQAIRSYTGNPFAAKSYTETFDGGGRSFNVLYRPIATVTSVTDTWASPPLVLDVSTYGVDLNAGLIYPTEKVSSGGNRVVEEMWDEGRQRYTVIYTSGSNTIPDDIRGAAIRWVCGLRNVTPGVNSERIGDYSYTASEAEKAMPGEVRLVLNLYRGARVHI